MLQRILSTLDGRRGAALLTAIALALCLPALRLGLQADDHILAWHVEHGQSPWWLFTATEAMLAQGRDTGAVAWWASPNLRVLFFRPLASALHWLELTMWPDATWAMSLTNIGVYLACVWVALQLYRRLLPAHVASLAALMFAIDDAHAHSVGWISGRNTLLALLGALVSLWLHMIARQDRRPSLAWWSTLGMAAALASAEAGTWSMGLLVAHALTLETGTWRARLQTIAPQLLIASAWVAVYVSGGFGLGGSSFYHSVRAPWSALGNGLLNLPLSVTSLLGPSLISFSIVAEPWTARAVALPIAAVLLWCVLPRVRWSPTTSFFALSSALCVVPTFLTMPQDRILIGSGIGAFGMLAGLLSDLTPSTVRGDVWTRRVLKTCHLGLAPLLFPALLGAQHGFERGTQAIVQTVRPQADVILINTPVELLANYVFAVLDRDGRRSALPNTLHQLYAGGSALSAHRVDAFTLDLTAERGWGSIAVERIFCAKDDMPKQGDVVQARNLTARVIKATPDGMPRTVRFTFPTPLESAERQWLTWRDTIPVAWTPPPIGARVTLPPVNLVMSLPQ